MRYTVQNDAAEASRLREEDQALRLLRQAAYGSSDSQRNSTVLNRIGTYLLARGQVTRDDLEEALWEQRERRRRGDIVPLGEVLVRRGTLTPRALAIALVGHQRERLRATGHQPQLLGERLLASGAVSPAQLVEALEEQISTAARGTSEPLGIILIRRGALTHADLAAHLAPAESAAAR
jgi:hypothetical protein